MKVAWIYCKYVYVYLCYLYLLCAHPSRQAVSAIHILVCGSVYMWMQEYEMAGRPGPGDGEEEAWSSRPHHNHPHQQDKAAH